MAHAIELNDHTTSGLQGGFIARLSKVVADLRAYRALHDELAAMTDRDLADLGLSRLNVRDVAREAVDGS